MFTLRCTVYTPYTVTVYTLYKVQILLGVRYTPYFLKEEIYSYYKIWVYTVRLYTKCTINEAYTVDGIQAYTVHHEKISKYKGRIYLQRYTRIPLKICFSLSFVSSTTCSSTAARAGEGTPRTHSTQQRVDPPFCDSPLVYALTRIWGKYCSAYSLSKLYVCTCTVLGENTVLFPFY